MTVLALAFALGVAAAPAPGGADARFQAANAAYLAGDFAAAAAGYEALVADGYDGADLHLDLGNARMRLGRRGLAAASYERALRADPGDADARANLALARADDVDRVVGASGSSLPARVAARIGDGAAAALFAIAWAALWLALAVRRRAPARARGALAAGAVVAACATVASGALLARKVADARTPAAVVVSAATPVREGPEEALRPAFELHEGTRVQVLEVRGEAARIRLENGLEGWMRTGDLEVI
ncbi:SH3 domain-containing protein [Anaeromyxobacter oryzisoli]|uniref:SH3 domain-containing protein n=1 Tax=Anaeromyxobacter oryzisoli TaxID=2925408 RepID=UPI001F590A82|nr:SH3 domain-containing protein [Anaeromyxobacter sp. SG63]